jgi:UDP-N-acetylmuramoyl-tripeptide--D-alanyl-D-alanine ligase
VDFRLPVVGYHQIENLMLVLAVAKELDLDLESVSARLSKLQLPAGRCEVIVDRHLTVLQDAYNSNPGSVRALLRTAKEMSKGRRLILVLGTMLELGDDSAALHSEMAADVMELKPYIVAAMGEFVPAFERFSETLGDRLVVAEDAASLGRLVGERLTGDELVLVKGSRGVHLEDAVPFLLSPKETSCSTTS